MDGLLSFHNYSYNGRMVQPKSRSNLTEKTTNSIETRGQEEDKQTSLFHFLSLSFKASFKCILPDIFFLTSNAIKSHSPYFIGMVFY